MYRDMSDKKVWVLFATMKSRPRPTDVDRYTRRYRELVDEGYDEHALFAWLHFLRHGDGIHEAEMMLAAYNERYPVGGKDD